MNNYTRNWNAGTVQLEHLFTDDPEAKIRDAMANADDGAVLACFGATNRMLTRSEYSAAYEADEILALSKKRRIAEHELLKRLRERFSK
jgi:hypothetical protein